MKQTRTNLTKLVTLLKDGEYHDGTTLGDKLNMTRSAVWKAIQKLNQYGIQISSIKNKGYAMTDPLILLDKQVIKKQLTDKNIEIDLFETLDSTNDFLKTFSAQDNKKKIRLCLSEQQTKGKGRLGRNWYSPFAQNIYFSCLYFFHKDLSELAGLSLIVSLAVAKTLSVYNSDKSFLVKWPNDIYYDNKKISGNLIEVQAETNNLCSAIIGIGINTNMLNDEKEIAQPWTSLRAITHEYIDRNKLIASLANHLFSYLKKFESQGLSAFIKEWNDGDYLFNRDITLNHVDSKITGIANGINEQGHLLLKCSDGTLKTFSSGDTTLS